jgi:excisionase family DNA binding protein
VEHKTDKDVTQRVDLLLTIKDVAHLIHRHPNTVYALIKAKRIKAHKLGGDIMVRKAELVRFLDSLPEYKPKKKGT